MGKYQVFERILFTAVICAIVIASAVGQGVLTNCPGDFSEPEEKKSVKSVKMMPSWPGCDVLEKTGKRDRCTSEKVALFIRENQPKNMPLAGEVLVSFVVEENGCLSNISIEDPEGIREEWIAQEVVRNMPHWIPGMDKYGVIRRVEMRVPVRFGGQ